MKHESIVVVYDSCQAIAEEIADKLGAETVSVQSMNVIKITIMQYIFIVALEFVLAFTGVALLIRYYNHKA
ncbi:MAG: hypothetical protein IKD75_03500 [Prevotella sp.]|nr:hypothetical protein [Prevotella sp.]